MYTYFASHSAVVIDANTQSRDVINGEATGAIQARVDRLLTRLYFIQEISKLQMNTKVTDRNYNNQQGCYSGHNVISNTSLSLTDVTLTLARRSGRRFGL